MNLHAIPKAAFFVITTITVFSLLSDHAFAHGGWGGWGGWWGHGDGCERGGHSVPEIGAGTAACAVSLLFGGAYLLKERFFGSKDDRSAE